MTANQRLEWTEKPRHSPASLGAPRSGLRNESTDHVTTERAKLQTRLVERARQKPWWHDRDGYTVPQYADPAVRGSQVGVVMGPFIYCLDAAYDYAVAWEVRSQEEPAVWANPTWWGANRLVLAALQENGRSQGFAVDIARKSFHPHTLMSGKPYERLSIYEDRRPLPARVVGDDCVIVDAYGHAYSCLTKNQLSLGSGVRVRYAPAACDSQFLIHMSRGQSEWLELRAAPTFELRWSSPKHRSVYGIAAGHCGATPLWTGDSAVCGFGDRLVCLRESKPVWEFQYPRLDRRDDSPPLRVITPDGKVVYETTSEVTVGSNMISDGCALYLVLSECTRHLSFLSKLSLASGEVLWTARIDGYSLGFAIVSVSPLGVILQNDTGLWFFGQDGSLRGQVEMDMDCAGCSDLVLLKDKTYVILSDFGLHEVELDPGRLPRAEPVTEPTVRRQVFLSHASEDKEAVVRPFYEACERRGVSAWFDAAEIRWGDSLVRRIEEGLRTSNVVLLFLSPSFLEKPWPQAALETALNLEVEGKRVVLPLVLGLSHDELVVRHPTVARKLYRRVPDYQRNQPVAPPLIDALVNELAERLQSEWQ